jgi:uncharacterized protein with PIN domain
MERIREEFDADRNEDFNAATTYKTETNRFELNCSLCNGAYFVNEEVSEQVARAVEKGLDNPFVCPDCRQEYEELAASGR